MSRQDLELSPEERERLARKGRLLYAKSCGPQGLGTCALGFALYHISRGQRGVAQDLVTFLEAELDKLRRLDRDGLLTTTEELAAQIRRGLASPVGRLS
jgi:hypothetical protein